MQCTAAGMAGPSHVQLTAEQVLEELMIDDEVSDDELDLSVEEPVCEGSDDEFEPDDSQERCSTKAALYTWKITNHCF